MSDHDFVFALDLSDPAAFDSMLAEVARAVFSHSGYAVQAVDQLTATLQSAFAERTADGRRRCSVRFQAQRGELHVVVSFDGAGEWRASHPLP